MENPMRIIFLAAAALMLINSAHAETPSVATDIAPVHSLVAKIMEGVGTPDLIVQSGASPHSYSLRPSEAEALQAADIVFWVSEGLTPWIEGSIEALAGDAESVELLESKGTTQLEFREGAMFEKHSDPHDEDEDHEEHDEEHEEDEEDEHDHEGHDPHAWLDPQNASVWLDVIASSLAALDPGHADTYAANATKGKTELKALISDIDAEIDHFRGTNFIVFHDAYQYFEHRFDISAVGSIRLGDAADPSPARIKEIRDTVAELGISCVFSEPQFNTGMVQTVFQGTEARAGVLDPLGSDLTPGPDLYPQLIRNLAANLTSCL